jgi:XRE family transcriptional regulator, regulator of sulfur utilization
MLRVHRNLSREEVETLREHLAELVPQAQANIPDLIRLMRLITRKSQAEYARLCGVAPRVLADVEAGHGSPRVDTLEKLLRPFGYRIGVVSGPQMPADLRRLAEKYGVRTPPLELTVPEKRKRVRRS